MKTFANRNDFLPITVTMYACKHLYMRIWWVFLRKGKYMRISGGYNNFINKEGWCWFYYYLTLLHLSLPNDARDVRLLEKKTAGLRASLHPPVIAEKKESLYKSYFPRIKLSPLPFSLCTHMHRYTRSQNVAHSAFVPCSHQWVPINCKINKY